MIDILKKIATRRTLLILTIIAVGLGVIGSLFYISYILRLNEFFGADIFDGSYIVTLIASNLLSYVGLIIMLIAILKIDKGNSEKIFCVSLITGLAITFFSAVCFPVITGSAFSNIPTDLIRTVLFAIPSVLMIIDIKTNHKIVFASCIAITVMMVLQFVSGIINLVTTPIYGFSHISSIFLNLKTALVWFVTLLYFIRFVKPNAPTKKNNVATIEESLQELKAAYEQGIISKEEYDSKKSELLNIF